MDQPDASNSPLELVVDPPMGQGAVLRVALAGFGMVVGLVLLAAFLGYRGSDRIQDSAQALARESQVSTGRGAQLEARILHETQNLMDELAWVLGLCIVLAAGTAGLAVWIIQRAFAKLEWQAAELAHVSWHMIDGHEKMARRFSHEMHDELGQSLSGLRRMLNRVPDAEFETTRRECVEIVDEVIGSVRKLSQVLRPVILDDFGLDSGLRWLCERFTQRTDVEVEYRSNLGGRLAEALETHLFRIAQEALTNIARHSEATRAWVALEQSGEKLKLVIADNGRGLQPRAGEANPSLGMVGMRARARQLGGELMVENRMEGGLRVQAEVPLAWGENNAGQEDPGIAG